jgi:putative nucleotidyltransferase with HDIG domain
LADIPPFPIVAIKALQVISSETGQLQELSDLITSDAGISAEILRMANSARFSTRVEVKSVFRAIHMLGLERIKGLVVTAAMKSYLRGSLEVPSLRACWRHSLACAVIAEMLARVGLLESDVAYTAGLLHDIGRLALVAGYPTMYANFLARAEAQPCDALQCERDLFGIDHCQQGRLLVSAWKLPAMFADIAARHHDAADAGDPAMLTIVRHSCAMADVLGFGVVCPLHAKTYQEILDEIPERERRQIASDPTEVAHFIADKINAIESE